MDHGDLTQELVFPLLASSDPDLHKAALSVINGHSGWVEEASRLLRSWLSAQPAVAENEDSIRGMLLAFADTTDVQALLAEALGRAETPHDMRLLLLGVMSACSLPKPPDNWVSALSAALDSSDEAELRQAIAAARALRVTSIDLKLLGVASNANLADSLRVDALAIIVPRLEKTPPELFDLLRRSARPEVPVVERLAAAGALEIARLDDAQLTVLAELLSTAGPLELPRLLAPFCAAKLRRLAKRWWQHW